jgi:hypothetical protein
MRDGIKKGLDAARANLKPGVALWGILLVFFFSYLTSERFRVGLGNIAAFKATIGYPFTFVVFVISGAILPELLKIAFFQRGRVEFVNFSNILYSGLLFGFAGVTVDIFYQYQAGWFGEGNDGWTLAAKTVVDQAIFSPIQNALILALLLWRGENFRSTTWRKVFSLNFLTSILFPVVVAMWCVWVPGVLLIYFMPTALQLPVASIISCFWVLILTFMSNRETKAPSADPDSRQLSIARSDASVSQNSSIS